MTTIGRVLVAGLILTGLASPALAGKYDRKGTLTNSNVSIPGCGSVSSVTVKYSVGSFMGEPTKQGIFKWSTANEATQRCINYSTSIYLRIQGQNGGSGYIKVSPTVPKSGQGFGHFGIASSPSWSAFICDPGGNSCLSTKDAKNLIKSGYSITGFRVRTRDIPKVKRQSRSNSSGSGSTSRSVGVLTNSSSGSTSTTQRRNMPNVFAPTVTTRSTTTRSRTNYKPRPTLKRDQFGKGRLNTCRRPNGKVYYAYNPCRTNARKSATRRTTTKRYASKPRVNTRTTRTRRTTTSRYTSKPRVNTRTTRTRRTTTNRYKSKPRVNSSRSRSNRYSSSRRQTSRRRCPYGQRRC